MVRHQRKAPMNNDTIHYKLFNSGQCEQPKARAKQKINEETLTKWGGGVSGSINPTYQKTH